MRSILSGGCTPPRLTKPLTSPRGRRRVLPLPKVTEFAHLSFSLCTSNALPPSSPMPTPSIDLLQRFCFAQILLGSRGTPEVEERTLALFTAARGRDQSARAELGGRRFLLAPPSPVFPASGRASASVSLFLIFSPFPLPFLFFFFPPSPPSTISPRRRFPRAGAEPASPRASPRPPPPYGERAPPPHPGTSGGGRRSRTGGGGLGPRVIMELVR